MTRSARLALLFLALLLAAGGCAAPGAPPAAEPEVAAPADASHADTAPAPEDPEAVAEARRLRTAGEPAAAEQALRDALRKPAARSDTPALQLELGKDLAAAGRLDEAAYHLVAAASTADRDRAREAWDALADVRDARGEPEEAARARLEAWNLSPGSERQRREPALMAAVEALPPVERMRLVAEHGAGPWARLSDEPARGADASLGVTVLVPLSGKLREFGEAFRTGAEMALAERDARGSGTIAVRLMPRDSEGDVLRAVVEAREAIVTDRTCTIVGPLLSVTSIAAGGVAESYRVPMIAPMATEPRLSSLGPRVLTLETPPEALAVPLARFAVDSLGARRFGVLLPSDGVSEDYERTFRAAVESLGGKVVVSLAFEPGETDFRRFVERVDREEVDALYVPGSATDLEPLASQLDFYDFRRRILGHGGWTHPSVLVPGNLALEGCVLAVQETEDPDSPFLAELARKLRRLSSQPLSRFHVQGYRAMTAVLGAVDAGGRTPDAIGELIRLAPFAGVRLPGDEVRLITFRGGVIGPAEWALLPPPDADAESDPDATDGE